MEGGTCLRCGKPYEPEDTVCYSCGAPIGETKTPTQPIRTMRTPSAAAASPSQPIPPAPPAPRPPRLAVATSPATKEATTRRPRHLWLGLGIALLALVVSGGGFYLVHGFTAGAPVSSQSTYQDPDHRFTFRRPTLWSALVTADGVQLTDSDGSSTAVIAALSMSTPETANSYASQQATAMGLDVAPAQQIGGVTWEQRSGLVTDLTDGAVHQVALFVTIHDGLIYTITFTSPIASYAQVNNLVYQPLLVSFRFED
ncbi:MAG: zinc ribbon domain-containing protein [Ktedonobacterales bacterium]